MKKLIYIVGISLLLAGCSYGSYDTREYDETYSSNIEEVNYEDYGNNEGVYLNDDMKKVIEKINALREKYKDSIDDIGNDSLYINIYEDNIEWMSDISFSNEEIRNDAYFNDLIELLDNTIASGLKDYIVEVKSKILEDENILIKKIGRSVVYVETRGSNSNYIHVKINLLDIKDDYYREAFNSIADDKYILGKVVMGNDLNLIDFANVSSDGYMYPYDNLNIRYNMFFKDRDFKKVNILLQGENKEELEYDDMGVFIKLLNTLDIKKQEEKDDLIEAYKNALKVKSDSKAISFDNYNLLIKSGKGDTYTGNDRKLVYFSIQAK